MSDAAEHAAGSSRVIVVAGPTASGKSALAAALAEHHGGIVVNADSRQVYRELGVGVAKPTPRERARAVHLLVGYVGIAEPYSAGMWSRHARRGLAVAFGEDARPAGKTATPGAERALSAQLARVPRVDVAVISGGSGLHVRSLLEGLPEMPTVSPEVRAHYERVFAEAGLPALQGELARRDPVYWDEVDRANPHRLMRALSVIEASGGTPFSALRARPRRPLPYVVEWVVLDPPRDELYARIERRVDGMLAAGLEEEARPLYPQRHLDALQTIGYREWWPYIEGEYDRARAVELIKQATRNYARRQTTWNRKLPGRRFARAEEALVALTRKPAAP